MHSSLRRTLPALAVLVVGFPFSSLAAGFSLDAVVADQTAHVELGSGLIGGSGCTGRNGGMDSGTVCTIDETENGPAPTTLPAFAGIDIRVSTTSGTNSVSADTRSLVLVESADADEVDFHGEGTFLTGRMGVFATLRDSKADEFHTRAEASTAMDDYFDITVPEAGEFFFRLRILLSEDDYTLEHVGAFSVIDLATNDVLLTRSDESFTFEEFDLSSHGGSQLRFAFAGSVAMAADAGFGNGADSLSQRTFSSTYWSAYAFRHVVPEPGTLPLLAFGFAAIAARRRAG